MSGPGEVDADGARVDPDADDTTGGFDPGVTVHVVRRVAPASRDAFERELAEVTRASRQMPGHLGVEIYRPTGDSLDYHIVFRFDRQRNLEAWQEQTRTTDGLTRLDALTVGPAQLTVLTGLETWFTLPGSPGKAAPPAWKMALLTWIGLWPLVVLLLWALDPAMAYMPWPLDTGFNTFVAVILMTWLVMPRITWLFRKWLWPEG
jgi:antibiotic biosynthesis monooxygenase (ABM) superfamily enzyme